MINLEKIKWEKYQPPPPYQEDPEWKSWGCFKVIEEMRKKT